MPIDLEIPENFLFRYNYNGRLVAVAISGRTEAEARHRFNLMSDADKRARIVAGLAHHRVDPLLDVRRWLSAVLARLPVRRVL